MATTAFILAGGLGTRLRPVSREAPKPMVLVAGRPFLEHLLDYLSAQGIKDAVLCIGYRGEVIKDHFGSCYRDLAISYSCEEELRGTGGALSQALEKSQPENAFLVCNGDTYFPIDISLLAAASHDYSWVLASFPSCDSKRYGALDVGPDGVLRGFGVPSSELPASGAVRFQANSGVWIGNPRHITLPLLGPQRKYSLEEYLSQSLTSGNVTAISRDFDTEFIDIGLPEDYRKAQTMGAFLQR